MFQKNANEQSLSVKAQQTGRESSSTAPESPSAQTPVKKSANKGNSSAALMDLLFNVILPSVLLDKLGKWLPGVSPLVVLMIAIAPPLIMGLRQLITAHSVNVYSLLGIANVLLTGGFALFRLSGFWFIVKEASLPFVLGMACWISSYSKKPLMGVLLANAQLVDANHLGARLAERGNATAWASVLRHGTQAFAASFFLSAGLNAWLALRTFADIDKSLSADLQAQQLNEQIAQMTWQGFIVIALPCLIVSSASIYWVLRRLSYLTGWPLEALFAGGDDSV